MNEKVLAVTNASGEVVAEYPDFEPGQPVKVRPDRLGANVTDADSGGVFAGPTRHPSTAVIRDVRHNTTVHVDRDRLASRC